MMSFGKQLKAERKRIDLNRADTVALFKNLSVATWRNWEEDRTTPPEWAQALILDFLRSFSPAKQGSFVERGRLPQH